MCGQAADERSQRYLNEKDAMAGERAKTHEELAQANAERWRLDEGLRKAEHTLTEYALRGSREPSPLAVL